MAEERKTQEQFLQELTDLRQRIAELEALATERQRAREALQQAHDELARQVEEQTAELTQVNEALQAEIAEHQWTEERVLRHGAVVEAINTIFRETLTCATPEEVSRTCLAVAEQLTGSKFGFIGEVNPTGRFDTMALSDPGWEACRMPEAEATMRLQDMEIRGLWGRSLQDEQSLMVNDPATHPDGVGLPEGHPPLTSFLGVPLKQAGRTIGLIGLGNKEPGYNQVDQEAVEALSVAFVEALNRVRTEAALSRSISRALVGQMLRDLQIAGDLSEGTMFRAGQELAVRVGATTLSHFLDTFIAMGLGTLTLVQADEGPRRWTFTGDGLMEVQEGSGQPTCNYTRGFLYGAIAQILGGARVGGVELACQSMGDERCRFIVQVIG